MNQDALQRHLGQLLIVDFNGQAATSDIKTLIGAPYYVGGVLLCRQNVATVDQIITLVNDLQCTARDAGHSKPLFICVSQDRDLESAPDPLVEPQLSKPAKLKTANPLEDIFRAGGTAGGLLRALGFNMVLADPCNINPEASNKLGTARKLSGDDIGHLSAIMLRALKSEGMMSCFKIFVEWDVADSHLVFSRPTYAVSKDALENVLIPYRRAVAEDVEAVMTSHITARADDSYMPSGLSKTVFNLLRKSLQYKGLIISRYSDTDAIKTDVGPAGSATLSFRSGNDCTIISHSFKKEIDAFHRVLGTTGAREILSPEILESLKRVDKLKDEYLNWESSLKKHSTRNLNFGRPPDKMLAFTRRRTTELRKIPIDPFDLSEDIAQLTQLWHFLLPQYAVPESRLSDLLARPNGTHFRVCLGKRLIAFVATFVNKDRPTSYIAALLVHPAYQSRGIGTALIRHAQKHLRFASTAQSVTIGSSCPRFWPGVPLDITKQSQSFFSNRGFCVAPGATARDYCVKLSTYEAPVAVLKRAATSGVKFLPWGENQYDECMTRQREIFGSDEVWMGAYERLAQAGQFQQALIAVDSVGKQVGWALMLEPGIGLSNDLAFPPLLGERTGQIGCVGVHPDARNKGVGLALVVHAALNLRQRGVDQIFIDWVTMVNWYEKAGFEVWREYRTMTLNEIG
ncbi:hypothetical protein AJ78_04371 [Emergomyces pasteurianus Ep9510]|uniref:N-acetyltransferase domain-containing protein n=1 Tax=Emergomyces pasteurianus Ep9510 TaxID=1447872 RepID=A0A1J9PH84_9EURO|nr:hypothetical protein AJ78_04371 [Emergomyces pasteurianus Ep9510]